MKIVTALEAKADLSALLDKASRGESILITRHGDPIAQLAPPARSAGEARSAMEFLLLQSIRLDMPVRDAIEAGRDDYS